MPDHIQLLLLLIFAGVYLLAALHLIDYLRIMWKEMREDDRHADRHQNRRLPL